MKYLVCKNDFLWHNGCDSFIQWMYHLHLTKCRYQCRHGNGVSWYCISTTFIQKGFFKTNLWTLLRFNSPHYFLFHHLPFLTERKIGLTRSWFLMKKFIGMFFCRLSLRADNLCIQCLDMILNFPWFKYAAEIWCTLNS